MSTYTKINFSDVTDSAPQHGMGEMGEARFARRAIGAQRIGLSKYKMNPDQRLGFGHRHGESEEVYVVIAGAGRFNIDGEIFPIAVHDVVYVPPEAVREWESGPDGMELLAFGGHSETESSDLDQGFWTE